MNRRGSSLHPALMAGMQGRIDASSRLPRRTRSQMQGYSGYAWRKLTGKEWRAYKRGYRRAVREMRRDGWAK